MLTYMQLYQQEWKLDKREIIGRSVFVNFVRKVNKAVHRIGIFSNFFQTFHNE